MTKYKKMKKKIQHNAVVDMAMEYMVRQAGNILVNGLEDTESIVTPKEFMLILGMDGSSTFMGVKVKPL